MLALARTEIRDASFGCVLWVLWVRARLLTCAPTPALRPKERAARVLWELLWVLSFSRCRPISRGSMLLTVKPEVSEKTNENGVFRGQKVVGGTGLEPVTSSV